eukprot:m.18569 g.18569  ORF g.18569 m.18569 type:complete len:1029 (+) comp7915_c1_seq1:2-3088(+)
MHSTRTPTRRIRAGMASKPALHMTHYMYVSVACLVALALNVHGAPIRVRFGQQGTTSSTTTNQATTVTKTVEDGFQQREMKEALKDAVGHEPHNISLPCPSPQQKLGIGVSGGIDYSNSPFKVTDVEDGSLASYAGVKVDDVILAINQETAVNTTYKRAAMLLHHAIKHCQTNIVLLVQHAQYSAEKSGMASFHVPEQTQSKKQEGVSEPDASSTQGGTPAPASTLLDLNGLPEEEKQELIAEMEEEKELVKQAEAEQQHEYEQDQGQDQSWKSDAETQEGIKDEAVAWQSSEADGQDEELLQTTDDPLPEVLETNEVENEVDVEDTVNDSEHSTTAHNSGTDSETTSSAAETPAELVDDIQSDESASVDEPLQPSFEKEKSARGDTSTSTSTQDSRWNGSTPHPSMKEKPGGDAVDWGAEPAGKDNPASTFINGTVQTSLPLQDTSHKHGQLTGSIAGEQQRDDDNDKDGEDVQEAVQEDASSSEKTGQDQTGELVEWSAQSTKPQGHRGHNETTAGHAPSGLVSGSVDAQVQGDDTDNKKGDDDANADPSQNPDVPFLADGTLHRQNEDEVEESKGKDKGFGEVGQDDTTSTTLQVTTKSVSLISDQTLGSTQRAEKILWRDSQQEKETQQTTQEVAQQGEEEGEKHFSHQAGDVETQAATAVGHLDEVSSSSTLSAESTASTPSLGSATQAKQTQEDEEDTTVGGGDSQTQVREESSTSSASSAQDEDTTAKATASASTSSTAPTVKPQMDNSNTDLEPRVKQDLSQVQESSEYNHGKQQGEGHRPSHGDDDAVSEDDDDDDDYGGTDDDNGNGLSDLVANDDDTDDTKDMDNVGDDDDDAEEIGFTAMHRQSQSTSNQQPKHDGHEHDQHRQQEQHSSTQELVTSSSEKDVVDSTLKSAVEKELETELEMLEEERDKELQAIRARVQARQHEFEQGVERASQDSQHEQAQRGFVGQQQEGHVSQQESLVVDVEVDGGDEVSSSSWIGWNVYFVLAFGLGLFLFQRPIRVMLGGGHRRREYARRR